MDEITKAIHEARAAQIDRIRKGMSNADEVLAPEDDIFKAHQVGDVHPSGKYVWTQLPNGKYDWRARKGQAKSDSSASASSSSDKKQDAKITADDAAKFLSKNADKWMEYQYDSLDDEKLTKKFDKIEKFVKLGKVFHWRDSEEAEVYKTKMEAKGYHCINIGEGSSTFAFALIKKDGIKKSIEDDEEDVDERTDVEKVEKSDIAEALSRGDIKIKKTGKEIKDQIADIIMPALTAKLAEKENEANDLLKECGNAPTKDVCDWWTDGIKMDCGYKVYEWNETYFDENRDQRFMPTFTAADEAEKKGDKPVDRVQAEARQRYNDVVHAICNIKVDIKTCEVMTSNLADGTTYELSAKQAIVLKF